MTIYTQSRETHLDSSDGIEGYCYVLLRTYEGPQRKHSLPAVAVAATNEGAAAASGSTAAAAASGSLAAVRRSCE